MVDQAEDVLGAILTGALAPKWKGRTCNFSLVGWNGI